MIEAGKVYYVPDDGSLVDWNAGLPGLPPKLMTVTERNEELRRIGMIERLIDKTWNTPVTPSEAARFIVEEFMPDASQERKREAIEAISDYASAWGSLCSSVEAESGPK